MTECQTTEKFCSGTGNKAVVLPRNTLLGCLVELEEIAYEKLTHRKQNCQMIKAFLVVSDTPNVAHPPAPTLRPPRVVF